MKKIALAIALTLGPASLVASDHFWIIGGGPSPHASEAQIEFNVRWVIESLREMVPDAVIHVFFANGSSGTPAAVEHLTELDSAGSAFESLARVFGQQGANRLRFRPHDIDEAEGGTAAESLLPELGRQLASLRPGDQGMIIYNGHGSWAPERDRNALRLWGESHLDVREFERLLSAVDTAVPVRFVFTQCYSGAFERAVHPDARDVLELAPGRRCGFFAESEDRLSEGCSASIEIGDYRDYTTYFFAALTGRTRLGETVGDRTDWDGDGSITPFDAHMFALVEGRNADLPRATSEVFLERWHPWYLRWVGTDRIPDNLYGRAARRVAEVNGMPAQAAELAATVEARFDLLVDSVARVTARQDEAESAARRVQAQIQASVGERWPALSYPYTANYGAYLEREIGEIDAFIRGREEYSELVRLQDEVDALEIHLVELDRDVSQLEKIRRLRVLARALEQLERHGSEEDLGAYGRLRSCEALPLG